MNEIIVSHEPLYESNFGRTPIKESDLDIIEEFLFLQEDTVKTYTKEETTNCSSRSTDS